MCQLALSRVTVHREGCVWYGSRAGEARVFQTLLYPATIAAALNYAEDSSTTVI